jgi:hypothetical protein
MFQTKVVERIKTHISPSITFFRKSCRLWDNVEKYGTARQATDDNIIRRMRFECWITKATDTHSEHVILIAFPRHQWLRERASLLRLYVQCLSHHLLMFAEPSPEGWAGTVQWVLCPEHEHFLRNFVLCIARADICHWCITTSFTRTPPRDNIT